MVAGKPFNVTWQDDGQSPSLQSFGAASFAIFAGNSQQQVRFLSLHFFDGHGTLARYISCAVFPGSSSGTVRISGSHVVFGGPSFSCFKQLVFNEVMLF
jgi:hypothetical protein